MNSFKIGGKCRVTGKYYEVFVNKTDYIAWQYGKNAQDAFPFPRECRRFYVRSDYESLAEQGCIARRRLKYGFGHGAS